MAARAARIIRSGAPVPVYVGDSVTRQWELQTQGATETEWSPTAISAATLLVLDLAEWTHGTCDAGGSASTVVDAERTETAANFWKGAELEFTSGDNAGERRVVSGFTPGTDTLTLDVTGNPLPAAPAAGDEYALHGYPIIVQQSLGTTYGTYSSSRASLQLTADAGMTASARRVAVLVALSWSDGANTERTYLRDVIDILPR